MQQDVNRINTILPATVVVTRTIHDGNLTEMRLHARLSAFIGIQKGTTVTIHAQYLVEYTVVLQILQKSIWKWKLEESENTLQDCSVFWMRVTN